MISCTTLRLKNDEILWTFLHIISSKMLPMLELHNATGKWEMLDSCVLFWLRALLAAAGCNGRTEKVREIFDAEYYRRMR
jgi:hypothetical protein